MSWPLVLFNLGYYVHSVEKLVRVGNVNVSPDIILASKTHDHALVVECKSGANVDVEQDASYSRMSMGDLWKSGVPMTTRRHTPVYAINDEHVSIIRGHTEHALMVFGSRGRRAIRGIGDFGNSELTRKLYTGIQVKSAAFPDVNAYPFSIRDKHDRIDRYVSRAVSVYLDDHPEMVGRSLATRADASAILRRAHPLHARFSGPHRSELRRAVARSVARQEERGAWWLGPAGRRAIGL